MEARKWLTGVALLLTVFFAGTVSAGAQENDFGAWVAIDVSKDVTKRFTLELEEEVRLFKDFGKLDRFSTSLSGDYEIAKWLKAGVGYMWIINHKVKSDTWDHRHRYFLFLQGRQKLGRVTVSLRERYQTTFVKEEAEAEDLGFEFVSRHILRSRLMADYDIRNNKLEPYVSAEMYTTLNKTGGTEINGMRYTLGAEFPVSGRMDLEPYLRLDQELNVKNPVSLFVVGVSLKLDL